MLNHKDNPLKNLDDDDYVIAAWLVSLWVISGICLYVLVFILNIFHL